MSRARLSDERGASLVLAMVVITCLGVFGISVLGGVSTGQRSTMIAEERTNQLYAAEAGMDHGVASLKADSNACAWNSTTKSWTTSSINGATVAVSCQWQSGGEPTETGLLAPYSLITTVGGITYPSSSTVVRGKVSGDVHSVSTPSVANTTAQTMTIDGDLTTGSACPAAAATSRITVNGSCAANQGLPDTGLILSVPVNQVSAPSAKTVSGCTILYPGRYGSNGGTSLPAFAASGKYYFASGTYYFRNVNLSLLGTVFGGAAGGTAQQLTGTGVTPCATDATAKAQQSTYTPSGTGVTFVFGGTSTMTVGANARVELFPRSGDANATAGVSIFSSMTSDEVRTGDTYVGSTVWDSGSTTTLITIGTGADVVVHGLTYTPYARTSLSFIANDEAQSSSVFRGGLAAARVALVNPVANVTVPIAGSASASSGPRTVTLTSTATPASGRATTITATVVPDTSSIAAWRVAD